MVLVGVGPGEVPREPPGTGLETVGRPDAGQVVALTRPAPAGPEDTGVPVGLTVGPPGPGHLPRPVVTVVLTPTTHTRVPVPGRVHSAEQESETPAVPETGGGEKFSCRGVCVWTCMSTYVYMCASVCT